MKWSNIFSDITKSIWLFIKMWFIKHHIIWDFSVIIHTQYNNVWKCDENKNKINCSDTLHGVYANFMFCYDEVAKIMKKTLEKWFITFSVDTLWCFFHNTISLTHHTVRKKKRKKTMETISCEFVCERKSEKDFRLNFSRHLIQKDVQFINFEL